MMAVPIPADLIIENASVITMDPLHPYANGIAIKRGKIVGLIYDKKKSWPLSSKGQRVNGEGLLLMPGLIDAHCHLRAQISRSLSVSCDRENVSSIGDIVSSLRAHSSQLPAGTWIRAAGYDPFYLKEQRHPTRWDLDKATTKHPIRLRHITRHASVLNSPALAAAGIDLNSPDPPGIAVERDPVSRVPTGLIYGGDAWLSKHAVPPLSSDELRAGASHLKNMLLSMGITAVQDATPTNDDSDIQFWNTQIENNWPITVQFMADVQRHQSLANILQKELPERSRKKLQLGPVKVVMEANPQLYPEPEELKKIAAEATSRHTSIAIHAVTPEMIWAALEAIQYASALHPEKSVRHRIEHLSLCLEAFLDDISKSRTIVVTNPSFIHEHGDRYLLNVEEAEHSLLYRMNSLYAAGVTVAAGSDAPVATFNPWVGIMAACSRATSTGKIIAGHEKLDRWQALELYTTGAARAAGWEDCRGMIKPGLNADFIALDKNPITCPLDELPHIQVVSTWINGKVAYQKN